MKTGSCPKCACTKLYVVHEVRQPDQESRNAIHPLVVTTAAVPSEELGLPDGNSYRAAIGSWETWICSACGFTEWYAKDFADAFAKLVALGSAGRRIHVHVVERPAGEPFR